MKYSIALVFLVSMALGAPALHGQRLADVVVNEIYTGTTDYIEICNLSPQSRDISAWKVYSTYGFSVYPTFQFPPNTTLLPGEVVVLVEDQVNLSSIYPNLPPALKVFNTNFSWGWLGNSSGMVIMADGGGLVQDTVHFGLTPVLIPNIALSQPFFNPIDRGASDIAYGNSIRRLGSIDSDDGQDWTTGNDGEDSPGVLNEGQLVGNFEIKKILFDDSANKIFENSASGSLSAALKIRGIETSTGQVIDQAQFDDMIGGQLNLQGQFSGVQAGTWAGQVWAPISLAFLNANQTRGLNFNTVCIGQSQLNWTFGGANGSTPRGTRAFSGNSAIGLQTTGASSPILQALVHAFQTAPFAFKVLFDGHPSVPELHLAFPVTGTSDRHLDAQMAHPGSGRIEIGAINIDGNQHYNLFAINSPLALGTGPLFGMEYGQFQLDQILTPLGTIPFHDYPGPDGTYYYQTQPYLVPAGIWLDYICIEIDQGQIKPSEVRRVHF